MWATTTSYAISRVGLWMTLTRISFYSMVTKLHPCDSRSMPTFKWASMLICYFDSLRPLRAPLQILAHSLLHTIKTYFKEKLLGLAYNQRRTILKGTLNTSLTFFPWSPLGGALSSSILLHVCDFCLWVTTYDNIMIFYEQAGAFLGRCGAGVLLPTIPS